MREEGEDVCHFGEGCLERYNRELGKRSAGGAGCESQRFVSEQLGRAKVSPAERGDTPPVNVSSSMRTSLFTCMASVMPQMVSEARRSMIETPTHKAW